MPINQQLPLLPLRPGVYLFRNKQGTVLYVGKATSLRHRVRSYFKQDPQQPSRLLPNPKLDPSKQHLVSHLVSVDTITTDTEIEALVLEANLIRQHQPPYNVLLRDDKFYLFIKITTQENPPRVFPVRQLKNDGARYFGPYSSASSVRQTLNLLRRIFPFHPEKETSRDKTFPHPLFAPGAKSAPHSLTERSKTSIKRQGEGESPSAVYNHNITSIIRFLQGDRQKYIKTLRHGMLQASRHRQYEQAAIFRDQLQAIERLEGSQKVYFPRHESFDVISLVHHPPASAVNVFSLRQGKLLNKNTFFLRHRATTPVADILRQFILQYYQVAQDIPPIILIPHQLSDQAALAQYINRTNPPVFSIPQRGRKKQLLTMGELNAQQLLTQEKSVFTTATQAKQALRELATTLRLSSSKKTCLTRIETYDISNLQGSLATGSMVVFINGQPNKNQYRKFKIKLNNQPNDYAMLREILHRRFSKRHHDWPLPDLILIDGGRGQLNVAKRTLNKLKLNIPLTALAKKEETLHYYSPASPHQAILSTNFPYDSPTLFLLQQMRDEAHRFTISYHRQLRSKQNTRSILDEIPTFGPKTKQKLHRHFGSLKAIRTASIKELAQVIGPIKANLLRDWL